MRARILIVGGGVMGTALALRAAQKTDPLRAPVVLFEREQVGSGSSGHSGAILRQFYSDRMLALMARESMREYAQFEARAGRSIGFRRCGVLTLAGPERPEWIAKLRAQVAELRELGLDMRVVEAAEIRALFPGARVHEGSVGAWEESAGFVDPVLTVSGFAALARSYGAVTRLATPVEEILVEDGRVVGARTAGGVCRAEQVVVAGGPWSGRLLRAVGIDLPLRVVCPENYFFGTDAAPEEETGSGQRSVGLSFDIEDASEDTSDEDLLKRENLHPVLIDLEMEFYARCEPAARRTRVGRVDYEDDLVVEDPDRKPAKPREEPRERARTALTGRLPDYEGAPDAGELISWYTLTPDAQPIVGPVPGIEGLYVAAGFSGHGFKLAPSIAQGLTQMLYGEPVTAFERELFDPARFQEVGALEWSGRFGL